MSYDNDITRPGLLLFSPEALKSSIPYLDEVTRQDTRTVRVCVFVCMAVYCPLRCLRHAAITSADVLFTVTASSTVYRVEKILRNYSTLRGVGLKSLKTLVNKSEN